jgi:hypothetical protein
MSGSGSSIVNSMNGSRNLVYIMSMWTNPVELGRRDNYFNGGNYYQEVHEPQLAENHTKEIV